MMTLRQLAAEPPTLPTRTTWYLTDLAEACGKHGLFSRQSPQKLKVLREHALIESAISSNRIEGVEVDKSRVGTLIFGKPALGDRDEEEFAVAGRMPRRGAGFDPPAPDPVAKGEKNQSAWHWSVCEMGKVGKLGTNSETR